MGRIASVSRMAKRDICDVGVEFRGDVLQHEHQQEEVERVQRPSEEARGHHMPLRAGPAGQRGNAEKGGS